MPNPMRMLLLSLFIFQAAIVVYHFLNLGNASTFLPNFDSALVFNEPQLQQQQQQMQQQQHPHPQQLLKDDHDDIYALAKYESYGFFDDIPESQWRLLQQNAIATPHHLSADRDKVSSYFYRPRG
jgi:Methyltransferase domain